MPAIIGGGVAVACEDDNESYHSPATPEGIISPPLATP